MKKISIGGWMVLCVLVFLSALTNINAQSIRVFPGTYDEIRPYADGLFMFKRDGKTGLFTIEEGKERVLCSLSADFISDFHDGYAIAVKKSAEGYLLYSVIDSSFTVFGISSKYYVEDYPFFSEGLLPVYVMENGKKRYGYIDNLGALKTLLKYKTAQPFYNGFAVVEEYSSSRPFQITCDGKEPSTFKKHKKFDNLQDVQQYFRIRSIDTIIESFDVVGQIDDEPRVCISSDGMYAGYEDKSGCEIVPVQFQYAGPFYNGLAIVRHGGKDRLINYIPSSRVAVNQFLDKRVKPENGQEGVRYVVDIPYSVPEGTDVFLRIYCGGQSREEKMSLCGNGSYSCSITVPKEERVAWVVIDGVKIAGQYFPKATPDVFELSFTASKTRVRANSSNKATITFTVSNPNDLDVTLDISSSGARPYFKKTTINVPANGEASFVGYYSGVKSKCSSKVTVSSDRTTAKSVTVQLIPYF